MQVIKINMFTATVRMYHTWTLA